MTADLPAEALTASGGRARLRPLAPNPAGGLDALWVLEADAIPGPLLTGAAPRAERPGPRAHRLRILHVNDMHNHIYDQAPDGTVTHRLAEMVRIVKEARQAAGPEDAVLFLSAGDDHTGTLLDDLVGWTAEEFEQDPSYRALSAAGLDASAIGNHEFDRGAAQLVLGQAEAAFPLLSANVHSSAHLHPGRHYHPAAIAEVKGLRIGLIGLTTAVETRVGQPSDPGMGVAGPPGVLANLLPLVDALSDVTVILSHCGYGDGAHLSGKAGTARSIGEADFALADLAGRVARRPVAILGAHTHTVLNEHGLEPQNLRAGVPIAQAGAMGRFLGEVVLDLGAGETAARLHPIGAGPVDEAFAAAHVAPLIAAVAGRMDEEIGRAGTAPGLAWATVKSARYTGECALANFMTDAMVEALAAQTGSAPDLAVVNGGSLLAGLDPGPVRFGQWFDAMPYSDEVYLLSATGAEIDAMLQSNARRVLRPEELAAADTGGFIARGFLHASRNLRYRIELGTGAAGARAADIRLMGHPLEGQRDRRFTIAATTYFALGAFGEHWDGAPISGGVPGDLPGYDLRGWPGRNTGFVWRQVLSDHIRRTGRIAAVPDGRLVVR